MATNVTRVRHPSYSSQIWHGFLGLLVLLGLYAFYLEYFKGHYFTGLTDVTPWGLYIAGFMFFLGISAGSTIVGLMVHGFGREDYRPLATRAIVVSLVCLSASMLFIMVHLGSIPRALLVPWVWRNPTSLLVYKSLSYYIFALLLLANLYYSIRIAKGQATVRDTAIAKWLSVGAAVYALTALIGADALLFAVVKAREFWNNPLLPPHYGVVALVSGTAMMVLIGVASGWFSRRRLVNNATLSHMGALLAFFIAITGFMDVLDLLIYTYSNEVIGGEARHFLTGSHLPISAVQVLGYSVAFVVLLFPKGRRTPWLAVAAVCALAAVAAYRYNLTTVGVEVQLYSFQQHVHYFPSWTEVSLSLGIAALTMLAYSILTGFLTEGERQGTTQ